ncbi:MAG: hypothetical protein HN403_06345 [Rhodospirillales bacterium]|jgi:flagellar assembly protein FliH|nr:hypothetical protein [Rhodospirillales bacterium]
MTTVHKFLFDTDFSEELPPPPVEETASETDEEETVEEPVIEEIVPTFSEEEVNEARENGYAKGRDEGVREAAEATERHIADALTVIGERIEGLFSAHMEDIDKIQMSAIVVISALAKKVLPEFSEREGLGEIERLARTILRRLRMEPRVVFVVNDLLRDAVHERLAATAESRTFAGSLEVVGDSAVAAGDCRIEWADGGAERNAAEMLADIDRIIAQNVDQTGAAQFVVPDLTEPDAPSGDDTGGEDTGEHEKEPDIEGEATDSASPVEQPDPPAETGGEEDVS